MKIEYQPNRYYRYDEMMELLTAWNQRYPKLTRLGSIGETYEGRAIPVLELSEQEGIAPEKKGGYLINGNLHGGEVGGSAAVLYIINEILSQYGENPFFTELLHDKVIYAIPRVNCDGAEVFLTTPYTLRGSTRDYYPPMDGLWPEDVNGDGEILQMRIQDDNGNFKCSDIDPRLMVNRAPGEVGGTYYRVVKEGVVHGDGWDLCTVRPTKGVDSNRSFPFDWLETAPTEHGYPASGDYPLAEVEPRNLADFVLSHPNICGIQDFHTYGGLHISPLAFYPEREPVPEDAMAIEKIAQEGAKLSGYMIHGFFPPGMTGMAHGNYVSWAYFMRGIIAWTTELWSYMREANPALPSSWSPYFSCTSADGQEWQDLLAWDERENGGTGFTPWKPFQHPQLGTVEIGGWKRKFLLDNPPEKFLEQECRKGAGFAYNHMAALPQLKLGKVGVKKENSVYEICAEILNTGYLPTSGSVMAQNLNRAGSVIATLLYEDGKKEVKNLGHLAGYKTVTIKWLAKAEAGQTLTLTVYADRAGMDQKKITLSEK